MSNENKNRKKLHPMNRLRRALGAGAMLAAIVVQPALARADGQVPAAITFDELASLPATMQDAYVSSLQTTLDELERSADVGDRRAALETRARLTALLAGLLEPSAEAARAAPNDLWINLGVLKEGRSSEGHDFDTLPLVKDLGDVASCSHGRSPCSPIFGFTDTGTLHCSSTHRTSACRSLGTRGIGFADAIRMCANGAASGFVTLGSQNHRLDCGKLKSLFDRQSKLIDRRCGSGKSACVAVRKQLAEIRASLAKSVETKRSAEKETAQLRDSVSKAGEIRSGLDSMNRRDREGADCDVPARRTPSFVALPETTGQNPLSLGTPGSLTGRRSESAPALVNAPAPILATAPAPSAALVPSATPSAAPSVTPSVIPSAAPARESVTQTETTPAARPQSLPQASSPPVVAAKAPSLVSRIIRAFTGSNDAPEPAKSEPAVRFEATRAEVPFATQVAAPAKPAEAAAPVQAPAPVAAPAAIPANVPGQAPAPATAVAPAPAPARVPATAVAPGIRDEELKALAAKLCGEPAVNVTNALRDEKLQDAVKNFREGIDVALGVDPRNPGVKPAAGCYVAFYPGGRTIMLRNGEVTLDHFNIPGAADPNHVVHAGNLFDDRAMSAVQAILQDKFPSFDAARILSLLLAKGPVVDEDLPNGGAFKRRWDALDGTPMELTIAKTGARTTAVLRMNVGTDHGRAFELDLTPPAPKPFPGSQTGAKKHRKK